MLDQFIRHVTNQSPLLMVYFGAIVLGCFHYRRAPTACLLTIIGSLVLLITSLASPVVFYYVMQRRIESGSAAPDDIMRYSKYISIGLGIGHALGTGLFVAAIFN